jgi:hypothetical protein
MTEEKQYKGYIVKIIADESPSSPRDWDNLGVMLCKHGKYDLGDADEWGKLDNFESWEEVRTALEKDWGAKVIIPLYLYDHSGITMNTTGFHCPWDSGQVGFIYATAKQIKENFGLKNCSYKAKQRTAEILEGEVKTYDQYLTGEVYGFQIEDPDGEEIDSCWGYYGDPEESGLMDEVRATIDNHVKNTQAKRESKLKTLIKKGVPLNKRAMILV